ncbi:MAG: hypothetical protein OXG96_07995 [Acidobacteria bacterium]|nr:hypothetical protein [Acidobacteriota bacterium]
MATYTIDTHATIRELEDAGMDSRQAEVVVAAISRADAELATKSDLKAETTAVRSAIDKLEASTKAETAALRAEIAGLKADLKIIKYFFGPAIIILLLKIAFF